MIVVGGITRLTNSGLSIAHWSPIHGVIPPLSDSDWQAEFALYKQIPQYKYLNPDMDLSAFKSIFWWEWAHRLLGRFTGLAFVLPLIYFGFKDYLRGEDILILGFVALLFALQGFLGWWMVSSGLSGQNVKVDAIRLAVHLGMAFLILSFLISGAHYRFTDEKSFLISNPWDLVVILAFLQVVLGALVAGSHAGFVHNDWPLIDGKILPTHYFELKPAIRNFFENTQTIQFNHRITAYLLAIGVFVLYRSRAKIKKRDYKIWSFLAFSLLCLQILIGIGALHIFGQSPPPNLIGVSMGAAHQTFGALTFCAIFLSWKSYPNYRS